MKSSQGCSIRAIYRLFAILSSLSFRKSANNNGSSALISNCVFIICHSIVKWICAHSAQIATGQFGLPVISNVNTPVSQCKLRLIDLLPSAPCRACVSSNLLIYYPSTCLLIYLVTRVTVFTVHFLKNRLKNYAWSKKFKKIRRDRALSLLWFVQFLSLPYFK